MSDVKTEVMKGCDWHRGRSGYVGDCKYCVTNALINLSLIVDSQRQLIELLTQKLSDVVTALTPPKPSKPLRITQPLDCADVSSKVPHLPHEWTWHPTRSTAITVSCEGYTSSSDRRCC